MTSGENKFYGGFMRFDISKKPVYYTVKDLFTKRWHTECSVTTDEDGCASFRGFYGRYGAEITLSGKTVTSELTLSKGADESIRKTV